LGLGGVALALFASVLEFFFITFNVSAARNIVTHEKQLSCRPVPGFGRGPRYISWGKPFIRMALAPLELTARVRKGAETLTGEVLWADANRVICDDKPTYED
jgi:hypothetical protein